MKKTLTLSLLILTATMITSAQNSFFPEMGQFFEQGYGDTHNEAAYDIAVLPTGVKAMAGFVEMGSGDKDFGFWFIDSIGALLLDTTYGSNYNDEAFGIVPFNSNQWILTGYTEVYNSPPVYRTNDYRKDFFILNIDSTGVIQWGVQYGQENYDNIAYSVIADGTDYAYVVGTQTAHIDGSSLMRLMKIDNTGTIIWNYTYNHGGNSVTAYDLMLSSTGNLICTANEFANNAQPTVFEIDNNGIELNYYSFSYSDDCKIYGMDTALDGGYVFAGRSISSTDDTNAFVLKTKSDFSTDWSTTLGNSGAEYFKDIVAADFSYIAVGTTNNRGEGLEDVYIVHLDSFGDTLLHKTLGGDSVDMGFGIAKFSGVPICYLAGYNTSYGIEEIGNSYMGGILTKGWNMMIQSGDNCKLPLVLFVDGTFVEDDTHPGWVHEEWGIIPNSERRLELKNFALKNHIDYLLFYDFNLIFNPPNDATAKARALTLIKVFNKYVANLKRNYGIQCGMINFYDSVTFDMSYKYVDTYNLKNEGKLHWITLEHEFWNSNHLPAVQSNGEKWHPYAPVGPLKTQNNNQPFNYNCNDHFEKVFENHIEYLQAMNQVKKKSGNKLYVFDYVQFFFNTWKEFDTIDPCNVARIYTSDNIDSQLVYVQKVEELTDALFLVYYNTYEENYDQGLAFLKHQPNTQDTNVIKRANKYSKRLDLFGKNFNKNTVIIPLFSNEYIFEKYDKACGQNNKFLGIFLFDYDTINELLYSVNTLKDVESEYIKQHDSIYNAGIYDSIKKVKIAAMSWFSRDCYVSIKEGGQNWDNKYVLFSKTERVPCPDYYSIMLPDSNDPHDLIKQNKLKTNAVKIYPNPSRQSIIIQFTGYPVFSKKSIRIYNLQGQNIFNQTMNNSIIYLNVKSVGLIKGMFILETECDNSIERFKVIIQ